MNAACAAEKGGSSSSSDASPTPFHILMLPDGETMDSRRRLDEELQHDYLGKRYEAYKDLSQNSQREDDPVWSGASAVCLSCRFCVLPV
jgi:hypothetical protein